MNIAAKGGEVEGAGGHVGTVSILIPTYNRARYLRECVLSMLSQTVLPLEIIIVDDGSTDDTRDVAHSFRDVRVRYIQQENAGKCVALNRALLLARGDYIWLFDDDDVALPDSLEKRLKRLEENRDCAFVGGWHIYGRDGPHGEIVVDRARKAKACRQPASLYRLLVDCYFSLSSVLARRECYERIGGFDNSLTSSEDYDVLIRLAREFKFDIVPEPVFIVRIHEGTRGSALNRYSVGKRREKLYRTDVTIGKKIRREIPLADYSMGDVTTGITLKRMQLLRRCVVMASKGLVEEMMSDLLDAYFGEMNSSISEQERWMLIDAMDSNYVVEGILENECIYYEGIRRILLICPAGISVVGALISGIWRICKERKLPFGARVDRLGILFITISGFISAGGVGKALGKAWGGRV
ncbi:glycosyltransferase family 2 protein [Pseudoxanthomonas mexicana]